MSDRLMQAAALLLIAAPWIYPFASGPSPAMEPWLVTCATASCLMLLVHAAPDLRRLLLMTIGPALICAAAVNCCMALIQYGGWAQELSRWVPTTPPGHAYGALRQRNQFATLTLLGLASLLPGVLGARPLRSMLPWAGLFVVGNAASASRVGALGLLVFCLAPCFWPAVRTRQFAAIAAVAIVGYLLASFGLPLLLVHLQNARPETVFDRVVSDVGCGSRRVLWSNVLDLIAMRPLWGWGWGELDYAHFMTLYDGARFCDILDNAHNLPLHIAVELGVPAAVVATLCVAALLAKGLRRTESQPHRLMAWLIVIFLLMHSLVEYPLWYGPFFVAMILAVGLLLQRPGDALGQSAQKARATLVSVAACAIACTAFVWADYRLISQAYLPATARFETYRNTAISELSPVLFKDQQRFAELTTTPLQASNARDVYRLALRVLHFSPEPIVVEKLIESLILLQQDAEASYYIKRYQAAFPEQARAWQETFNNRRAQQ